jgi:hypothetical protein
MKAQNNWPGDRANLPYRKYPALCVVLFVFMFAPAIAAEIVLGRFLTHLIPRPGFLAVLCVAPGMIVLLVLGMLVGAIIWLLAMKPFVKRDVLAEFFLGGPRVPVFSALCSKIFDWTYGESSPGSEL